MSTERTARRNCLKRGVGLGASATFAAAPIHGALAAGMIDGQPPARASGKARSVILIFNCGAPSHLDLFDPKPLAGDTVRGPFASIDTAVAGLQVTELLPGFAQRARHWSVVRTVHHQHGGHNSGMHWSIVGKPYKIDSTLINPGPSDYPGLGTLVGWLAQRGGYSGAAPPYVITPYPHCDSLLYVTPGQYGGCLGGRYDPFVLDADPNSPNFRVKNLGLCDGMEAPRLNDRLSLRAALDRPNRGIFGRAGADLDLFHAQAARLVTSEAAASAFDLNLEPPEVRERYGRHTWGQSHLLARRLVEAGAPFVATINGRSIVWDTHENNFARLKNDLVPPMERAYTALLDDLIDRGLLDSTLVIWMGDFGRTPQINAKAGRDHWPQCYSVVLAGGGIQGGRVVGCSDRVGAVPKDRPVSPADIHATVFAALGYSIRELGYQLTDGRPMPLTDGDPIRELL
jgi:hypothetical protein